MSQIDGHKVRLIEADLAVTGADRTRIGNYRLITTPTNGPRYQRAPSHPGRTRSATMP